jgi:hypothetical protein
MNESEKDPRVSDAEPSEETLEATKESVEAPEPTGSEREKPKGGGAERGALDAAKETKNLDEQASVAKVGPYQPEPPAAAFSIGPLLGFLVAFALLAVIVLVFVL